MSDELLINAAKQALSLLKGEKEFEHDLTIYGGTTGGLNVVRIKRVIKQLEEAISLTEKGKSF